MENASKALLIAGGVLIAIIILSMLLMVYSKIIEIKNAQEEEKELKQLVAFNSQFEAYNKKLMYGADVITLINKVFESNKKYPIEIWIKAYDKDNPDKEGKIGRIWKDNLEKRHINIGEKDEFEINEKDRYSCGNMEYGENGRVTKITIILKEKAKGEEK